MGTSVGYRRLVIPRPRVRLRRALVAASIALLLGVAAACGGASGGSASGQPKLTTVTLALDWTPNTDHTGFYVADTLGYYRQAGIRLKILPYGSTTPDTLVSAGKADFGISFQDIVAYDRAAGLGVTSVTAILQHTASVIAVSPSSGITRPRQLDGKIYAGFGGPAEVPSLQAVIRADGGQGKFRTVTLNTSAYDAVYAHRADFAIPLVTWEVIDARLRGKPLRQFAFTDYGFPDRYEVVMIGRNSLLSGNPDLARRFVGATARGFAYAAAHPDAGADILIKDNPGAFNDQRLPRESAELMAKSFYLDSRGNFGPQTLAMWSNYTNFLYSAGLLVDGKGHKLTTKPDVSGWFTNAYLPGS